MKQKSLDFVHHLYHHLHLHHQYRQCCYKGLLSQKTEDLLTEKERIKHIKFVQFAWITAKAVLSQIQNATTQK